MINLFYLATIAFIPYPAQLLGDFGDSTAFAVYASAISISIIASFALAEYSTRAGLVTTDPSAAELKDQRIDGISVVAGFVVSVPLVLLTGELWLGYLCWIIGPNVHLLLRLGGSGKH